MGTKVVFGWISGCFLLCATQLTLAGPLDFGGAPETPEKVQSDLSGLSNNDAGDYEYRIGPLDLVQIDVFQADELSRTSRVNTKGFVSMPLIGPVEIGGLSVEEAERRLEQKLAEKYMQDPHVTLFIQEYQSQKITVEGWVKSPGVFPLKGKTTFLQAIADAKGMDKLADFDEVAIFRNVEGKGTVGYILSYEKVRNGEQVDPVLHNGDIIVVNESGSKAAWDTFSKTLTSFVGWSVLF